MLAAWAQLLQSGCLIDLIEAVFHHARTRQVADVKRQFLYPPQAKAASTSSIATTNAALALGRMTQYSFRCGLKWFFLAPGRPY
jgi:hypothetical protein